MDTSNFGGKSHMQYSDLKRGYGNLFRVAKIEPERRRELGDWCRKIIKNRSRYEAIAERVGCPWYAVAVIHVRESSCNFGRHFHNGDPLDARTVKRPAGRPIEGEPPFTFEASAADALRLKSWVSVPSWEIERVLYELERYNGTGYFGHGVNSPYLWSFTDLYIAGKYVEDGKFDSSAIDQQPGCAAIIKMLIERGEIELKTGGDMQSVVDKIKGLEIVVPVLASAATGSSALLAVRAVAEVLGVRPKDVEALDEALDELGASELVSALMSAERKLEGFLDVQSAPAALVSSKPAEPAAGPLDNLLGGEAFKGYKTLIGGLIFLAAVIAETLLPGASVTMIALAKWIGGFLAGAGMVAKIERLWMDFRESFFDGRRHTGERVTEVSRGWS